MKKRNMGNTAEGLEQCLIMHCAPTLASLKTANLFTCKYTCIQSLETSIMYWETEMKEKGLSLFILQKQENRALIYVCRMKKLQQDLEKPGVMNLLRKYGYQDTNPRHAISHLIERLEENGTFPHEIGLFLGYPLDDVIGFIVNKGKNCHCIGCWKVYCNKEEAERTFCKYKKCTDVYNRLWRNGRSIQKLTVA